MLHFFPSISINAASVTINGGHETRGSAYSWGRYIENNDITAIFAEGQNDMWINVDVPSDSHIYTRCSYKKECDEMELDIYKNALLLDYDNSTEQIYDSNTVVPFLAAKIDNSTGKSEKIYIRIHRGNRFKGMFVTSISLHERYRNGRKIFLFRGTAKNSGNKQIAPSGMDSSVLSLALSSSSEIPQGAIVKRVSTTGTQSPRQGNVHHVIMPKNDGNWYTSVYSDDTSGTYNISEADKIPVKQTWMFKYNALSPVKSQMDNVSLSLEWRYDIADTGYHPF